MIIACNLMLGVRLASLLVVSFFRPFLSDMTFIDLMKYNQTSLELRRLVDAFYSPTRRAYNPSDALTIVTLQLSIALRKTKKCVNCCCLTVIDNVLLGLYARRVGL